jgi:hypothetical protein
MRPDEDDAVRLPPLTPEVAGDEELLGAAVDNVVRSDCVARRRAREIVEHHGWLGEAVDPEAWGLFLEIEARTNERVADLLVVIARWAFEEGRRHPLPAAGEGDRS